MEMPASSTSASCNLKTRPSCWRSMAQSLGSLRRRLRGAPQSPTVARYNLESTDVGILSAIQGKRQRVLGLLVLSGARDILRWHCRAAAAKAAATGGHSEPPYSLAPDAPAGSAVAPYTCTKVK
nr:uncharacterized protein LOC127330023 [Lolium perenne]